MSTPRRNWLKFPTLRAHWRTYVRRGRMPRNSSAGCRVRATCASNQTSVAHGGHGCRRLTPAGDMEARRGTRQRCQSVRNDMERRRSKSFITDRSAGRDDQSGAGGAIGVSSDRRMRVAPSAATDAVAKAGCRLELFEAWMAETALSKNHVATAREPKRPSREWGSENPAARSTAKHKRQRSSRSPARRDVMKLRQARCYR